MTRPYLLLVRSSSSSIGGLVMPSGAGATPDTGGRVSSIDSGRKPAGAVPAAGLLVGAGARAQAGRRRSQQAYQLVGSPGHVVVDHDHVELPRRVELGRGEREPALLHRRRLRPSAG